MIFHEIYKREMHARDLVKYFYERFSGFLCLKCDENSLTELRICYLMSFDVCQVNFLGTSSEFIRTSIEYLRTSSEFLRTLSEFLRTSSAFIRTSNECF